MRKKFLSLILAMCMVLSLFPMTALAAVEAVTAKVEAQATPKKGTVNLTVTLTGAAEDGTDSKILFKVADAVTNGDKTEAPAAPKADDGTIESTDIGTGKTWTEYTVTESATSMEVTADDGQYVLVAYVEQNETETNKYDIKFGAVAGPVDDGVDDTVAVTGVTLSKSTLELTVGGDPATLTATVTPDTATDKTVTWTTSNDKVATVTNGTVTAVGAGTATITATAGGQSDTCEVTVKAATPTTIELQDTWVEVAGTTLTYDGTAKEPTVTVTDKTDGSDPKPLTADTDYTVKYADNINAGTNTAKVTVTGKGNYTGTINKTFSIQKATLTPTVALKADQTITKVYDGTNAVAAADLGKLDISFKVGETAKTLTQDDYTVSATYGDADVGTNKAITVTITLNDGTDAKTNYTLAAVTGNVTGAITQKAIESSASVVPRQLPPLT